MPLLQWLVLWSIGLLPVWIFPILPLCKTVGPFDLPIKYLVYVLWTISIVLLVPKAFREDKSKAEQGIDFKLEGPTSDIQRLKGELEQTITGLLDQRDQLAEMDRVMRIGFERAVVALPPRRMSLRASFTFEASQPAVTLHSRVGWLVRWVQRPLLRLKKLILG